MPQPSTDVLIVGAGPTGLTLAIELRRLGLSARLIDKNAHAARYSQALVVQARTLEQWERYGIADQAVAAGRKLHHAHLFSDRKPIVQISFDLIPGKYPFLLFLPQKDTEQILTEHLGSINGAAIERQTELLSFTQDDSGVTSQIRLPDGSTEELRTSWILGADGAHSTLRSQLNIPFSGEAVHLSFLLGDLALEGDDLPGDGIVVHLHHGDVVFLGRLPSGSTRVIYANHDSMDSSAGTSQQVSRSTQSVPLEAFNGAFDRMGLHLQATASDWSTPFHVNDRQAGKYRVGRALLAGDASHIHSPVGGQGMNTGIQDAANLAWKLAAVERGAHSSLLDTYESERTEVGRELLQRTGAALHTATSTNPAVAFFRDHLARAATSLEAVQRTAAGFVSETAIQYRSSPLSEDHGGHGSLHPGDRVPNPTLPGTASQPARDLLAPLSSARSLLLAVNTPDLPSNVPADSPHLAVLSLTTTGHPELRDLFGTEPAFFVIRPDGYLGLRAPATSQSDIQAYLDLVGALPASA